MINTRAMIIVMLVSSINLFAQDKDLKDLYTEFELTEIPTFEWEIRGIERLRELGLLLHEKKEK